MITRMISDEELVKATALVQAAMLASLPEPEDCTGEFSDQFEAKIENLKKTAKRKAAWRKFAKTAVAAVLVVLISFGMLCAVNTEVRASVVGWFKQQFGTVTKYWTDADEHTTLPTYEETWIPDGYEVIQIEEASFGRVVVYQLGDDISTAFVIDYSIATEDSPLHLYTFDGEYDIQQVTVNGYIGDFYIARDPDVSSALLWLDESTNTIINVMAYLDEEDMLRIAKGIRLVE